MVDTKVPTIIFMLPKQSEASELLPAGSKSNKRLGEKKAILSYYKYNKT